MRGNKKKNNIQNGKLQNDVSTHRYYLPHACTYTVWMPRALFEQILYAAEESNFKLNCVFWCMLVIQNFNQFITNYY